MFSGGKTPREFLAYASFCTFIDKVADFKCKRFWLNERLTITIYICITVVSRLKTQSAGLAELVVIYDSLFAFSTRRHSFAFLN